MKIIGLTGGIASGKSTVSDMLITQGHAVICADKVAHQVMARGGPAYDSIVAKFGKEFVSMDGEIDRDKLGEHVFGNPDLLNSLNEIVHPHVEEAILEEIAYLKTKNSRLVILDIPLLFEAEFEHLCEEIWLVYVPASTQIERLMKRNSLSREQAEKRLASQMSIEDKKEKSDFVIDNSGSLDNTRSQLKELLKKDLH